MPGSRPIILPGILVIVMAENFSVERRKLMRFLGAKVVLTPAGEAFPGQLAGLVASLVGMLVGSLGPQAIRNAHASHHRLAGA